MSADKTSSYARYVGLVPPDPRITAIDATYSTSNAGTDALTQAGPIPGNCVPQQVTSMALRATGTVDASASEDIYTLRAGMPGFPAGTEGAGFVAKPAAETNYYGFTEPGTMTHWEAVTYLDGSLATAVSASWVHGITLASGKVVIAYELAITSPSTADLVVTRVRSTAGVWSSTVTAYTQSGSYNSSRSAHPCLLQLPSGRVLLFYWVELSTGDTQVQMKYSDDEGASWSLGSTYCLPSPITYSTAGASATDYDAMRRLRVGYLGDSVVLFASLRFADNSLGSGESRDALNQYASADLGSTFVLVAEGAVDSGDYSGTYQDVVVSDGVIVVGWVPGNTSGGSAPRVARLGSAWEPFTEAALVTPTSSPFTAIANTVTAAGSGYQTTEADFALVRSDEGVLYMFIRKLDASPTAGQVYQSRDNGLSFVRLGYGLVLSGFLTAMWYRTNDASTNVRDYCAVWQGGRAILLHHWDANPGNEDNSVGAMYLGGWSTVSMPLISDSGQATDRASWLLTYAPMDLPSDVGWTGTVTGTATLASGALSLVTSAQSAYYDIAPSGTVAEGVIVHTSLLEVSGGSVSSPGIVLQVRVADGASDYEIRVAFGPASSSGQVRLFDVNGGTIDTQTLDTSGGVDVIVALANDDVAWWVRPRSNGTAHGWTAGTGSGSLTANGTPGAANRVRFGNAAGSTAESKWYMVNYTSDSNAGLQLASGQTNPDDLNPRSYGTGPVGLLSGAKIRAVDGPTYIGDEWVCAARYRYAKERMLPQVQPSPRVPWRSTDETEHKIAVMLDPTITTASHGQNVVLAVCVFGANGWRTGSIEGDTGGGSWSTITTFDAANGFDSLAYTRQGASLVPNTSSSDTPYLHFEEARGWTASLGSSKYRRVGSNVEGVWSGDTTNKRARVFLSGVDGTEPSSGTMALVPTDFAIVFRPNVTAYAGYRLVIDAQTTVDGYFEIGDLVVGGVVLLGPEPSDGGSVESTTYSDREMLPSRLPRSRVRGPKARTFQLAWTEGLDLTSLHADDPNYFASSSSGAFSAGIEPEALYLFEGLQDTLDADRIPCALLLLEKGTGGSGDVEVINRREKLALVQLVGPVTRTNVQGQPGYDEVATLGTITAEEVV